MIMVKTHITSKRYTDTTLDLVFHNSYRTLDNTRLNVNKLAAGIKTIKILFLIMIDILS